MSESTPPPSDEIETTPDVELMSIDRQNLIVDILAIVNEDQEDDDADDDITFTATPDQVIQLDDVITKFVQKQRGELIQLISTVNFDHECERMSIGGKTAISAMRTKMIDKVLEVWKQK